MRSTIYYLLFVHDVMSFKAASIEMNAIENVKMALNDYHSIRQVIEVIGSS